MTDIEVFDKKAFADAKGINYSSLGGMIGQMINKPSIYIDLRKKGFADTQIPKWVKRPDTRAGPLPGPVVTPLPGPAPTSAAAPATPPAIVTLAQENANQPSNQPSK